MNDVKDIIGEVIVINCDFRELQSKLQAYYNERPLNKYDVSQTIIQLSESSSRICATLIASKKQKNFRKKQQL